MEECLVKAGTLAAAYHAALIELTERGQHTDCADWNTTQKEVSMTMVVEQPLSEPMISKLFIGGPRELEQYRQEMLDGMLDFEIRRGNWVYTYHDRMVNYHGKDQIAFVIEELRRNPSSRRAVILVRDVDVDMGSDDPACLQHIEYFIREGRLECKVLFRSNDACKATFMNAFALIQLQKRIADAIGVPMGSYVHRAASFHCYEKDFGMLEGYVRRIRAAEDEEDITYAYEGEDGWKEMMEDMKPEIAKTVEELKNR